MTAKAFIIVAIVITIIVATASCAMIGIDSASNRTAHAERYDVTRIAPGMQLAAQGVVR